MYALILQIVDRINGLNIGVIAVSLVVTIEEHGHHACLPVVTMEHIRFKAHEVAHEVEDRTLEEAVSLDIEHIINIDLIEVEIVFVVDKIEDHSVLLKREQSCVERTPAHVDHLPSNETELLAVLDLDLLVKRKDYSCVNALSVKFDRKASHNVCKSADFDEGTAFRSCH
jgi:hypothetical protein